MPGWARLMLAAVLLAYAPAATVRADDSPTSLVIVAPDVELTIAADKVATVLPSAARSEAFVARWPGAAAAALGLGGRASAWIPPEGRDPDDAVGQVLALQEAVASALLESDVRPRQLTLGPGAAALAAATGASHALFARVRAVPDRGTAVAMLVDLRTGAVLRHGVVTDIDGRAEPEALARELAGDLLARWREVPPLAPLPPGGTDPATEPQDDIARATARQLQRLMRHPRRIADPMLAAELRRIACRLDATLCASSRWIVLDEPGARAAVLPDGTTVVHTGLLLRLRDEAELAFVLAHEQAHLRQDDVRGRLAGGRRGLRSEAARGREAAADREAAARIAAAGYDANSASRFWERLRSEQAAAGDVPLPGSHPSAAERVAATRSAAAELHGGDRGRERWLAVARPRRAAWLETEVDSGDPDATIAMLEAAAREAAGEDGDIDSLRDWTDALATARARRDTQATSMARTPPSRPDDRASEPDVRTVRVLGLRLPTRLTWRQRPGIGAVAWTVDGRTLLNDSAPGAPRWSRGSPASTTTARIVSALRRSGWTGVRTHGARAHDFGGVAGTRVELALVDANGLRYRGTLAHAVRNGRLTWAAWMAPEAVYHARDAADVAAMLDGLRFPR